MRRPGGRAKTPARPARIALALLLLLALAGCAAAPAASLGQPGGPESEKEPGTSEVDEGGMPIAAVPQPQPVPASDSLPEDAFFTIEYTHPDLQTTERILLRGGQRVEGTAWLTDWAAGEVAALWADGEGSGS